MTHPGPPAGPAPPRLAERVYVVAAFALAALVAVRALDAALARDAHATFPAAPSVGRPRDVDMDRLREQVRRGDLSDHEAVFARPVEAPPPAR